MLADQYKPELLNLTSQSGLAFADGIKAIGGNPDSISQGVRKKGDLAAFVELHIEQGGILEQEKIQIGVVEGIVGIQRWNVTVEGVANHAGTTPMNMRHDALLSAAKLTIAFNEVIIGHEGRQVGTIGKIAVAPDAYNVIPGKAILGMEIRDMSVEKIEQLFHETERKADSIASATGTKISFVQASKP